MQPLRIDHRQPERGQKHPSGEPLSTLQRFRTALDNGDVDFGQNLIARNSGVIRVGDALEVLARGPAKAYGAGESDTTPAPEAQENATVEIAWQGVSFTGNNQQILLEQLEQQEFVFLTPAGLGFAAAAASGWK